MNEMRKLMEAVSQLDEAYQNTKTEHAGAKKGRGAFYGRKKEAKRDSNKNRRRADKSAVSEEPGDYDHGYNYEGPQADDFESGEDEHHSEINAMKGLSGKHHAVMVELIDLEKQLQQQGHTASAASLSNIISDMQHAHKGLFRAAIHDFGKGYDQPGHERNL